MTVAPELSFYIGTLAQLIQFLFALESAGFITSTCMFYLRRLWEEESYIFDMFKMIVKKRQNSF
jgi:hypothetical protein